MKKIVLVVVTDHIQLPVTLLSSSFHETLLVTSAVCLTGALMCMLPPVGGVKLVLSLGALKGVQGK